MRRGHNSIREHGTAAVRTATTSRRGRWSGAAVLARSGDSCSNPNYDHASVRSHPKRDRGLEDEALTAGIGSKQRVRMQDRVTQRPGTPIVALEAAGSSPVTRL